MGKGRGGGAGAKGCMADRGARVQEGAAQGVGGKYEGVTAGGRQDGVQGTNKMRGRCIFS